MQAQKEKKMIWDLPTRVFHWCLAAAALVSFVSVRLDEMEIHFASGGFILFLILFRLFWGIWGPATALFLQFAPLPKRIRQWRAGTAVGHSPWGALSVFALLGAVGAQGLTGLFADDGIYLTGPLRDYVSSMTANSATKLHSQISDVIIVLVALHIMAIAVYTLVKRSDLLRNFLSGQSQNAPEAIQPRSLFLVATTIFFAAAPVIWIFS